MTKAEAHRFLDDARAGRIRASFGDIRAALCATGDISASRIWSREDVPEPAVPMRRLHGRRFVFEPGTRVLKVGA